MGDGPHLRCSFIPPISGHIRQAELQICFSPYPCRDARTCSSLETAEPNPRHSNDDSPSLEQRNSENS
jgi:hypothetical protein